MARSEANPEARRDAPCPAVSAQERADAGNGYRSSTILVRDTGFQEDDWSGEFTQWLGEDALPAQPAQAALDVENAALAEEIVPRLRADRPHSHCIPVAHGRPGILAGPPLAATGLPGPTSAPAGAFLPINTPWPGGAASTRWKSTRRSPNGSRRSSGCFVRIGKRTTIRSGWAGARTMETAVSGTEPVHPFNSEGHFQFDRGRVRRGSALWRPAP